MRGSRKIEGTRSKKAANVSFELFESKNVKVLDTGPTTATVIGCAVLIAMESDHGPNRT